MRERGYGYPRETLSGRLRRLHASRPGLSVLLALLSIAPYGCQTATRGSDGSSVRAGRSAMDQLRTRATMERSHATPVRIEASLFSGLDAAAVSPLSPSELEAGSPARRTLREVFASATPPPNAKAGDEKPSDDARLTAQLRYAQAKQKLLEGNSGDAITDLQAATRLDPTASELWRELGNAQYASGRRTSASNSFRQAVELGLREPQVMYTLARDSARSDRSDEALSLLLAAAQLDLHGSDPALAWLIHAELAPLLARRGEITAARESLSLAADLPEPFASPTNLKSELAELYRRRDEMWQQIGDWSCKLGDAETAVRAYDRAGEFPSSDVESLSTRRLFALLNAGRPAEAAISLLEQIQQSNQCANDGAIALARQLRVATDLGPTLASAIGQLERDTVRKFTATQRVGLLRVQAYLLASDAGMEIRERALALDSADVTPIVHDLVGSLPTDVHVRTRMAGEVGDAVPRVASQLADALVLDGIGLDELVREPSKGTGFTIVQAYVEAKRGEAVRALARLQAVQSWPESCRVTARLAEVELAVASARWDAVESGLSQLASETTAEGRLAYATALRAAQRPARAMEVLGTLDRVDQNTSAQLLRAELALRSDSGETADRAYARVIELDRFDERAYEGLITLHLPNGRLPDADKLNGSLRALRETIPQGRVARFLTVRNAMARGARDQAESSLMGMVRRSPPNPIALELLTGLWEAPRADAKTALAAPERFLREQVAQHPGSAPLLASLARVLAAAGKTEESEQLLEKTVAEHPSPTLSRLREHIVRDVMKDPARADRLALERLDQSPATIDNIVERAELQSRRNDLAGAERTLATGLPAEMTLTNEQSSLLLSILTKAPIDAKTSASHALAMVGLFERLGPDVKLLPVMQIKRLTAATIAYASEPVKLTDEVVRIAKSQPEIGLTAYRPVLQILDSIGSRSAMLPFLHELVARTQSDWREDLVELYAGVVAVQGTEKDAEALVELATDRPLLVRWLASLRKRSTARDEIDATTSDSYMRAEIAYVLASGMGAAGREAESEATLALAIRLDQTHGMANNDLGYNLADRGERLDEAEKMLARALAEEPENANVMDSAAWLKYKRGQLKDEVAADGTVTREGAISMLRRAIEKDEEGDNAIMRDHLGDALWRDGQHEMAVEMWQEASTMIAPTLAVLTDRKDDPSLTARVYRATAASLRAKLAAVQAKNEPVTAPLASEAHPKTEPPKGGDGQAKDR